MKPVISPESFEQLRAQSQRCLIDFLRAEIQLGFTFVDASAYERDQGDAHHSQHTKEQAEKAANGIRHFLDRVADQEVRGLIADRCSQLERAITAL